MNKTEQFLSFQNCKDIVTVKFSIILPLQRELLGGGGHLHIFPYGDVSLDKISFSGFYSETRLQGIIFL